jgi:membrane-associated phospholipid phosphatase
MTRLVRPLFFLLSLATGLPALPAEPAAQTLSPSVQVQPSGTERPFLSASLQGLADFGSSPLRLGARDLVWLLPSAVGLGVVLNNDVPLYDRLAKGDARKEWLDHSMPAVSALGDGLMEFSGAALAAKLGDARLARTSATAMQGLVVVAVYGEALKLAAWSNRPYVDDSAHRFFAYDQDSQGMPSGHSFSAFCVAEVYGAEYGRALPYTLASLVAYSRIYNQAHWPSDVFAGSVLGIIAGVQARHETANQVPAAVHFSVLDRPGTPLLVAHVAF